MTDLIETRAYIPRETAEVRLPIPVGKYRDAGVLFRNGLPLIRVEGPPAAGQYHFDEVSGIYTFSAADTGRQIVGNTLVDRLSVGLPA